MDDPYIWMENLNDKRVLEFINVKNDLFRSRFQSISRKLYEKVLRSYELPILVDVRAARDVIFMLFRERDRYTVYIRREDERLQILDSKALGEDVIVQWIDPDTEGKKLTYAYSRGTDMVILKILEVDSMKEIDSLEGYVGNVIWVNDSKYYYVRFYREGKTPDGIDAPASRIFLREVGGREEMVFGSGLPTRHYTLIEKSKFSDKVFINVGYGWIRNWIYAGDLSNPSTWRLIYDPGETRASPIEYVNGRYYVLVYDRNGLGRIVSINNSGIEREVICEDQKFPLQDAAICSKSIVAVYLVDASSRIRIFTLDGVLKREIKFDKPGNITNLRSTGEYCLFRYVSFDTPYRIYKIINEEPVLMEEVSTRQVCVDEHFINSFDNTPIHIFHIYNCEKRTKKAVLTGYGGFGLPYSPRFLDFFSVFLEDGGEYIIANIRGGGEYGRKWHEAARRENRENAYGDFISVIKWLKDKGYKVVVHGVSNGGLLCGVVYTRVPDLIEGAVIGFPLLDMLRYHKLYIGSLWIPEYGDPEKPEDREYLLKISPYHNLIPGKHYPPCLLYTGLNDDRVHPSHALKFAAKLEEIGVEHYLRVETASGHIGANPKVTAREKADILAFIYAVLNITINDHGDGS